MAKMQVTILVEVEYAGDRPPTLPLIQAALQTHANSVMLLPFKPTKAVAEKAETITVDD